MKILIVDDSIMMRTLLKDFFTEQAEVVVGEAANGKKALELTQDLDPDLIIMDIDMPVMNGVEAAEKILAVAKKPIVIFANDIAPEIVSKLQGIGVAEVIQKPLISRFNEPEYSKDFISRIRTRAANFSHHNNNTYQKNRDQKRTDSKKQSPSEQIRIVVLGASTGGPEAVKNVLSSLPADFPVPIALVQHIETRFSEGYAEWLDGHCKLRVKPAANGDIPEPGTVYTASGDTHLVVSPKKLILEDSPHIKNQRPSVEKLFQSAAEAYGSAVMGVILTGMGNDGAEGAAAIRQAGGFMIVQDESTSFINGMPKAAIEAGGASVILPIQEIAAAMEEAVYAHR
ncbi:MAG: chemotaxis-specific protein-glutamate methyltransferase CheB [Spirochaetales bacterium]|nr:chemotaxis-specific protein-glutamate methyltransferase CheB [Spirochaetales bacterium]MCF7938505.1 chemotaxis-specific protein-glutamate methyltransferase CheB [Spirochaetales bacterium]